MKSKSRIEFIDLAKGFCILLVVFSHSGEDYGSRFDLAMTSFRMPLYFVLSGLFFKEYNGFLDFMVRKTNKLLIPFVFFYIIIAWLLAFIVIGDLHEHWWCSVWFEEFNGMPMGIWFLLCLFWVNIFAYVMLLIAKQTKNEPFVFCLLSLFLGGIGYYLGDRQINLPLYWDSALAALPFFAFGRIIRRYTHFLDKDNKWYLNPLFAIVCFIVVYVLVKGKVNYRENLYNIPIVLVYLCGILGTMGVLYISKWIRRLPVISYIGRYSIMVLCSHQLVIMPLHYLCHSFNITGLKETLLVWFITSSICCLLIEPMRRFLPHVTAQKDVFEIKTNNIPEK